MPSDTPSKLLDDYQPWPDVPDELLGSERRVRSGWQELLEHLAPLGRDELLEHFARGDQYLAEVERREQPWLYRCRSLVDSGIPLGGSTDAPYGSADPWSAMAAAVQRRTRSGQNIGSTEQLSPERALALFTSSATAPGGPPRRLAPGMLADLCLLDRPWADARARLTAGDVAATIRGGEVIYRRDTAQTPPLD